MKAVISNRIYLEVTPEYKQKLLDELSYTILPARQDDPPVTLRNVGIIRSNLVSIPSGRVDLIPEGYEIVEKRVHSPVSFPAFRGLLRPAQQEVYDNLEDSCILNAWVSFGKTFTALAVAGKLGQKTLVVTHTVALRNQWVREIEKVYGFKPGIIGSGHFDTSTPIVVGNVQSLYKKVAETATLFGTIILDEMHHVSSPTFSKIIDKSYARYKIGLSGTIERKDGKHVVFRDYFSPKIFKPPPENFMVPQVHLIRSEVRFPDGARIPWATRINALAFNEEYQHSVAIMAAAYAAKGHRVLVVSDRVRFLKNCAELVGDKAISVTGEIPHEQRENLMSFIKTGEKQILFGTQSIFSEGISLNELSCIILGTPINNEPLLTQLVGRVLRKQEGKLQPVIIDIQLKGKTAQKQAKNRLGFYMKQGWEIKTI